MMNQKTTNPIYVFLIINQSTKKEIGQILFHQNGTIEDYTLISQLKSNILSQLTEDQSLTIKISSMNHMIYGQSANRKTFYFIAIRPNKIKQSHNKHSFNSKYIESLIKNIEHQGIKQLIDSNGELSQIGIKTLKFSIEQHVTTYTAKRIQMKRVMKYFHMMMILMKVNRLIKELLKILEDSKIKLRHRKVFDNDNDNEYNSSNSIHNINNAIMSHNVTNTENKQINQLNKRINALYYQFLFFTVIIILFVLSFKPNRCVLQC